MLFRELKNLLKQLIDETSCPHCEGKYKEEDIVIIGSLKDEVYLHVGCENCNSHILVNAVINRITKNRKHKGLKIRNLGRNISPITTNEVIEIHQFLDTFDGDFKTLFQPKA